MGAGEGRQFLFPGRTWAIRERVDLGIEWRERAFSVTFCGDAS